MNRDIGVSGRVSHEGVELYSNSWAVVVGIDSYRDPRIPRLQFAEADARAVAALLPSLGFPRSNIRLLLGSSATITRERLLELLQDDLNSEMGLGDRLLVYLAGHGVSSHVHGEFRGHILLPSSELRGEWPTRDNPHVNSNPAKAIEMRQLLDTIRGLNARHKLLLMDACFSGLAARDVADAGKVRLGDPRIKRWISEPVTQVLTAGRSGERAFECPQYGHGIFTHHLLKALEGNADTDGRGLINFSQLVSFVKDRVSRELDADQDPQPAQFGEGEYLLLLPQPDRTLPELIVSLDGQGDFGSLGAAVRAACAGQRIVVKPGEYAENETIVMDRDIEILGGGDGPEKCSIKFADSATINLAGGRASVRNVALYGFRRYELVKVPSGHLFLRDCIIDRGNVTISGPDTKAFVSGTRIDGWIKLDGGSEGTFEACAINEIMMSAKTLRLRSVTLRAMEIVKGDCLADDCHSSSSSPPPPFGSVSIGEEAKALLRRSRFFGRMCGIASSSLESKVEDCEIADCFDRGIDVARGHLSVLRSNVHNSGVGISVRRSASATVEDCDLGNNRRGAWHIQPGAKVIRRNNQE